MAYARLTYVKKARVTRICERCGKIVEKGDPYSWFKFRFGGPHYRCSEHTPTAPERESNPKRRALMYAEQEYEGVQEADSPGDAATALEGAIANVEEARDSFQEAVEAWRGTNLEQSEMYGTFEGAMYELEGWLSDAEQAVSDLTEAQDEFDANGEDNEDWRDLLTNLDSIPEIDF